MNAVHELLVGSEDFAAGCRQAHRFLDRNLLVRYARVQVIEPESCRADHPTFWDRLAAGTAANRQAAALLLEELREAGGHSLAGLADLPQGHQSKLLHTLAHLQDGFFGIDSFFYNLLEDSHEVSEALRLEIEQRPAFFWLLRIAAATGVPEAEPFALLRSRAKGG